MPRLGWWLSALALLIASGAMGCASSRDQSGVFGAGSGSPSGQAGSDATVDGGSTSAPFDGSGNDETTGGGDDGTTGGGDGTTGGGDDGGGLHVPIGAMDSGMPCPATCAELKANCGIVTDTRCGGTITCGQCDGGVCGALAPNVCAMGMALSPDGGVCMPKSCADVGANCGAVSNGCGGLLQCGTCDAGASCGIGDAANVCAAGVPDAACPAQSCAQQGIFCGMAGDGCGNVIDCGPCASPNTCGGGGQAGLCGAPVCRPRDCASQGISCGPAGDGCGGPLDCGNTCSLPQTCGGGKPGTCGCQGVCALVPICPAPEGGPAPTTTLTGVVMDPGAINPLYNVLVYIPNDPSDPGLRPFPTGTSCDVCGANAAGTPLVTTHTGTDGTFSLSGVPAGKAITLVIQLGRWRRQFQVDITNSCGANTAAGTAAGGSTIANGVLTMPKNKGEGDIPLTAIVTGNADAMECVFWKMGVDAVEFTNPGGRGRIQLMTGSAHDITQVSPANQHPPDRGFVDTCTANQGPCTNACSGTCTQEHWGGGAYIDPTTPSEMVLFQNNGVPAVNPIGNYDLTVLSCQDWAWTTAAHPAVQHYPELVTYANGGGRIFVTHYSYDYLRYQNVVNNTPTPPNPFLGTANWGSQGGPWAVKFAFVDVNTMDNPKGPAFASWLANPPSALSPTPAWMPANTPTVTIHEAKSSVASVVPPTQQWMYISPPDDGVHFSPNLFTFNTPIGAANTAQCGRGLFSDFHVTPNGASGGALKGTHNVAFPAECGTRAPMSAQEKILEFMLFDLGSCVQPYKPICTPTTCMAQGIECGPAGDGCGGALDCHPCPPGQICGAGGPGKCGVPVCTPKDCKALGYMCGPAANGCGGLNDCGPCPMGQTCGGGGKPGVCGQLRCTPIDCAAQNLQCGPAGDGCGNTIDCGPCTPPQVCGGGGPGKCGAPQCTPRDCASQSIQCGPAGDGCGNQIDCGPCPAGQICGFSGPGKCGGTR